MKLTDAVSVIPGVTLTPPSLCCTPRMVSHNPCSMRSITLTLLTLCSRLPMTRALCEASASRSWKSYTVSLSYLGPVNFFTPEEYLSQPPGIKPGVASCVAAKSEAAPHQNAVNPPSAASLHCGSIFRDEYLRRFSKRVVPFCAFRMYFTAAWIEF